MFTFSNFNGSWKQCECVCKNYTPISTLRGKCNCLCSIVIYYDGDFLCLKFGQRFTTCMKLCLKTILTHTKTCIFSLSYALHTHWCIYQPSITDYCEIDINCLLEFCDRHTKKYIFFVCSTQLCFQFISITNKDCMLLNTETIGGRLGGHVIR